MPSPKLCLLKLRSVPVSNLTWWTCFWIVLADLLKSRACMLSNVGDLKHIPCRFLSVIMKKNRMSNIVEFHQIKHKGRSLSNVNKKTRQPIYNSVNTWNCCVLSVIMKKNKRGNTSIFYLCHVNCKVKFNFGRLYTLCSGGVVVPVFRLALCGIWFGSTLQ